MPTITGCIRKAGAALQTEDKDAILERFNALTKDGTASAEAARQAIDEQIAAVRALLESSLAPGASENQAPKERAEAMAAKGQPVHQDPGEAPEVATKAVVTEAVRTAAGNRDRKPSEMRAELLRMVDEAIPRAKDSTDQDVRVYEATAVGTRMTEAEQAEYKRLGTGQPRDKYMQRIAKEKAALHERAAERIGFVSFKVPGDGTFRLLNTVDRLKAFRSKVESSPGFKDRQAPLQSPRVNGYGMKKEPNTPFGVERGSGGPKAVIENMVDDGDPQAAVDYAAARGLDVAEVLKGDKARLGKVAGLTPTAEAVGEFEPEASVSDLIAAYKAAKAQERALADAKNVNLSELARAVDATRAARAPLVAKLAEQPALSAMNDNGLRRILAGSAQKPGQWQLTRFDQNGEPWGDSQYTSQEAAIDDFLREVDIDTLEMGDAEPAAPAQPAAASAAPPAQQAESAGDMLGEFLASYDTPQEAGLARKALAATVTWKDGLKGPLSDHILGEYRKGARVALTASGMAFVNSDMRGWSKRHIGEYGMQFANWLSSRDDAPAQQAEPSAPAPGKRADGRTIPTEGDEVFMESAGAFGMPAIVNGTVVRGKDGLRVKITAARGMLGETTSQKYAPLTPDWTLKGEESGASRRRREQAETLERESADRRAEYESDRTAAAERNGTLDASKAKLGDVIETPDGGLEVVAETDERGGLYTRPLDAGGESARGIGGDLRGYKFRPDVQLPTDGSQLIRRDGQDQALFADGWQDVKWNEDVQRYERVTPPTVKQRADSMRRKPEGEAAGRYMIAERKPVKRGAIGGAEPEFEYVPDARLGRYDSVDAAKAAYVRMMDPKVTSADDAAVARMFGRGEFSNVKVVSAPEQTLEVSTRTDAAPIQDVGEKIGGARKDMAVSTGTTRRKSDDDRPAWARRFKVSQIVTPGGMAEEVKDAGRWIIRDEKNLDWMGKPKQIGGTFATKEEADAAVPIAAVSQKHRVVLASTRQGEPERYEIWRDISDRKRVKVVEQQFGSRDEAMRYMAVNAVAIIETNTTFGEADMPLPPDRARSGPARRTGNVTGADFKDAFGLRGVEFGNWNNQDERQSLMNDAWDGLMDLADVLGIPPKAIGLNGDLALAFGARGHGLQSARAHYELERAVINLTKERGAGSLAHEWFHALDHYLGRQDGKSSATWEVKADGTRTLKVGKEAESDMVSSGFSGNRSKVRPEVRAAYEALLKTMTTKAQTYVEDTAKVDKFTGAAREDLARSLDSLRRDLAEQKDVRYWKRNNAPAPAEVLAEFDAIAKAMLDGDVASITTDWRLLASDKGKAVSRYTNDALERLSAIYKQVRGRSGFDGTNRQGVLDRLGSSLTRYAQRLKLLADAQAGTEKVKSVPTEFAMNARELDQGRGGDYWTTPHEMAARAFQGYVEDKIAERGGVSRFLNYGPENAGILTPWGFKRPFPAGDERKAINAAMDKFVSALQTKTDDAGNVALFSRTGNFRAGAAVSSSALRAEVSKITANWDQDLADVEVVNRVEDLPADIQQAVRNVGSENTVRGLAMPDGRVFLVAENISTLDEGRFVLFHETYGHIGMRAFLGDSYLRQMKVLRNANPALAKEADRWFSLYGEDEIAARVAVGFPEAKARSMVEALAVEEALADRAGNEPPPKAWKTIVAAIQRGLRRLGLGSVADMLEGMTEAETVDLLVQARRTVQAGQRMRAGEMEPAMSRDAERAALRELSNADEMFALPRSDGKTVEQIAAEIYPSAKVSQLRPDPGQAARYSIEMPSGEVGYLYVRKPNQYGPTVYGFDLKDGDMTNIVEGRPGDNADAIPDDVEDVYIDVSKLKGTGAGQRIYAIAAAYAHNTDRVFIGDPAGLTDEAMRRRAENMLASALRYGTTAHLAPHPRQLAGAAKVGVPPLKWVYGDHIGNIRSLIAVNVQAMQNAGLDDAAISYDLAAGTFRDSSGSPITRAELDVLAKTTYLGDAGVAGSRTLARNALLRSLLREEGRGSTSGGQRDGLLALLAGINRGRPDAVGALFSRRTSQDTLRDVIPPAVQEWITDRTTSQRGFNRGWHRTVGTQLHKAKVNKEFGKAYYAVQDYMKDVSRMATLAADLAPDMLPQIETLGDLAKLAPTLASPAAYKQRKADIKAASDALFDGTLRYTRDESGEAVKVDPDSDELGGLVWTDAELKARGLSDRAVAMYRQSRQAIGQSLDNMLAADLYRQISVMDPEMVASDPGDYAGLMNGLRRAASSDTPRDTINQLQAAIRTRLGAIQTALDGQPNQHTPGLMQRRQDLRKVQEMIGEKVQRIEDLKDAGYTPLMRFGPYAVDVVNAQGRRVFFGMYESQAQANKAARNFRGDGLKVTQSVMPQKQFEALQGVSPETAMLFAEMLGVEKNEAMQTWLKNAVAEQSALKRHIRRKGIEGFDDDGGRVLAAFITSNARAASRALHSQRISDAVENIQQGDVQDEARALAEYVNNPKEEAQAIRSLLFIQYIGGSIASAIVNLTQTFAQTFPYLSQYGGGMKAGQRVGAAMKLALADKIPDAKLAAALARAERDGVVKPQEVFQLQAEASRSLGSNLYARSILAAWGSMFQLAEQFNRRVAFIAAYNTAVEQKIDDPFAFAENAVDETQSVFNKGNRPNWSRGAVKATLFTFKTFTIQYVEFLKRLATAGEPGSPERAAGQKAAALALMSIMVMAGSSGLPFADDLDDIIDTVAQGLGYNWTTKLQRDRFLDNLLGETFSGILQHGLSGVPGVPFDVSQRLGMANLLPGTGLLKQSEANKQNQVLEVFGVAGSAVRDATQGQFLPIAIRNLMIGLDTYETGMYRDRRGRNVTEADPLDAALKAIGLQPSVVARAQRDIGMQIEARNLYRAVKEEITDAWAQAQFQGDAEGVKKARDAMRKWNESNPDSRIIVLPQTIQQRVRQMRLSKADRTVANTPRPLRASTAEALQ